MRTDYPDDAVVEFYVFTYSAAGASVAPSAALVAADITIVKDGTTLKSTTNGITVTSPAHSLVGVHKVKVDMSVDTGDVGYWATGSRYDAILAPATTTVDGQTVRWQAPGGAWSCEIAGGAIARVKDIQSRLPAALTGGRIDASVGAVAAGAITAAAIATDAIDADALSADALNEIADALLKRDWTAVSGEAARSVLNALRKLRNKVTNNAGTLEVYKEDGTTQAYTQTVTTDAAQEPFKTLGN